MKKIKFKSSIVFLYFSQTNLEKNRALISKISSEKKICLRIFKYPVRTMPFQVIQHILLEIFVFAYPRETSHVNNTRTYSEGSVYILLYLLTSKLEIRHIFSMNCLQTKTEKYHRLVVLILEYLNSMKAQ